VVEVIVIYDFNPEAWPFEAIIQHDDGQREYHQHARDNGDGTVSVYKLQLPRGYVEQRYPKAQVKLAERSSDKAKKWLDLYEQVFGKKKG
jgi:hypothetical protein